MPSEVSESETPDALYRKVERYLKDLIGFFTGTSIAGEDYASLRRDLLSNPAYGELSPSFIKRCRDTGALWSFAKSVDPSWEPRRTFLREQFEPLLEYLERSDQQRPAPMPGTYDASAWTGVTSPQQRLRAVRTLIPIAQAAVSVLIKQLEHPRPNGGPPLDEVEEALGHLRKLHTTLGELLRAAENGSLGVLSGEGMIVEAARYGRRAAKALKNDPMPYALSATLLGLFTACGFPGIGGYLGGMALQVKKQVGQ